MNNLIPARRLKIGRLTISMRNSTHWFKWPYHENTLTHGTFAIGFTFFTYLLTDKHK